MVLCILKAVMHLNKSLFMSYNAGTMTSFAVAQKTIIKNVELQEFRQQGAVEMRGALFTDHHQC